MTVFDTSCDRCGTFLIGPGDDDADTPGVRGAPEVPGVRGAPEVPGVRGAPEVPGVRGAPEVPGVQGAPEVPGVRGAPEVTGPFGIRFLYHPGDFLLKDDSGLLCKPCWAAARAWLGEERPENRCARCGEGVEHSRSLHLHRAGDPIAWQLCRLHAVEFLNHLRTVEPKLDVETFSLAGDWSAAYHQKKP